MRLFPCGQALHTLHFDRYFTLCSHGPFVGGPLFRFVPLLDASSVTHTSTSTSGSTLPTFGRQIAGIHPRAQSKCPAGRRPFETKSYPRRYEGNVTFGYSATSFALSLFDTSQRGVSSDIFGI